MTFEINVDIGTSFDTQIPTIRIHEKDVKSAFAEVHLFNNGVPIGNIFNTYNGNNTCTIVCNKVLIVEELTISSDNENYLLIPISSGDSFTIMPGIMLFEVYLRQNGGSGESSYTTVTVVNFAVYVTESIVNNATKVSNNTIGTIGDAIREIAAARASYENIGTRIDAIEENATSANSNIENLTHELSNARNDIGSKVTYESVSYDVGGSGGLSTADNSMKLYNVTFNIPCGEISAGTKGVMFCTNENTQLLVSSNGDVFVREYNNSADEWQSFQKKNITKNHLEIEECNNEFDLSGCNDSTKIYHYQFINTVNGNPIAVDGNLGGFVRYANGVWYIMSNTAHAGLYTITPNGVVHPIADTAPRENSDSLITSGAIYTALNTKYDKSSVESGIAELSIPTSVNLDTIKTCTCRYVRNGPLATVFITIIFNEGNCNYIELNSLPFAKSEPSITQRVRSFTSRDVYFKANLKGPYLYIYLDNGSRAENERLSISFTYETNC